MSAHCIVYIATSADGFIADEEGGVDWLPHPEDPEDTLGYLQLMKTIDTIIMGRKSYEQICTFGEWAWPEKRCIVFSSKEIAIIHPSITCTDQKPQEVMSTLAGNVWLLGGADLIHSFAKEGLIHRYIVTVLPNTYIKKGVYLKLPEQMAYSVVHGCAGGLSQFVFDMI